MKTERLFAGVVLGMALWLAGCGGPTLENPDPEVLAGPEGEAALSLSASEEGLYEPPCNGRTMWTFNWFSDAAMTELVGDKRCDCNGRRASWGVRGRYEKFTEVVCSRQPEGVVSPDDVKR
ncbi:DUF6289 family protein [Myxococcus stipitatus]|uniref:DUF6289 family protein n=1 Tax=Myxococcus stipitatus TaxID=83455 RepID=UPI00314507F2